MADPTGEQSFKINGIELISFSIRPQNAGTASGERFEFNIRQEQKTRAEKNLIIIFTTITITGMENKDVLCSLEVAAGFVIPSFDSIIIRKSGGEYVIPHELSVAINRISVSTARGVLYSQLRGTYLQQWVLPLLDFE